MIVHEIVVCLSARRFDNRPAPLQEATGQPELDLAGRSEISFGSLLDVAEGSDSDKVLEARLRPGTDTAIIPCMISKIVLRSSRPGYAFIWLHSKRTHWPQG
jgi:hypothetical protein